MVIRNSTSIVARTICIFFFALLACEKRIEEPGPSHSNSHSSQLTTTARCIRNNPNRPLRTTPSISPDPKCPEDTGTQPQLRRGTVTFVDVENKVMSVDIAETDETRQRGLMFVRSMPADSGMIFTFDRETNHMFWMHNTCISLDMIFIDKDGYIVGIEENTPTMNDSTFQVGCPSQYVLEVNAGYCAKHGIRPGQRIRFEK